MTDFYPKDVSKLIDCQNFEMKLNDIKIIMFDLLSALIHLHKKKIFHRDVKPSNLLVNIKGEVVLGDFGLCREFPT